MIISGEKFACDACVRGHRVSNCQHNDRPLQHINKKGRPVSQCQHCRAMRKSRASQVKCDCGEKTSKCAHLQQTVEGHKETCCCNHGGRCTCTHKKESPLGTVPESDSDAERQPVVTAARAKAAARRRRANTLHSEGGLAFDEHGHHKPSAKLNRAAQKCSPYQLSRANSASGTSGLEASANAAGSQAASNSQGEQLNVKSEATSPLKPDNQFDNVNGPTPPLDLSGGADYSFMSNGMPDLFTPGFSSDIDAPMYSAGLGATHVDWSHYNLGEVKNENFAPSSYSQAGAQSYSSIFEIGSASEHLPTLVNTTSNSGNVSEVEDFMGGNDGDFDSFGHSSLFRPSNMFGNSTDITSIDYNNFAGEALAKPGDEGPMIGGGVSMVEDDPAFWKPDYYDAAHENTLSALEANPLAASDIDNFWES